MRANSSDRSVASTFQFLFSPFVFFLYQRFVHYRDAFSNLHELFMQSSMKRFDRFVQRNKRRALLSIRKRDNRLPLMIGVYRAAFTISISQIVRRYLSSMWYVDWELKMNLDESTLFQVIGARYLPQVIFETWLNDRCIRFTVSNQSIPTKKRLTQTTEQINHQDYVHFSTASLETKSISLLSREEK